MINTDFLNTYNSQSLFTAHTTQPDYLSKICKHYYCDILSISELIKSPNNIVKKFQHVHDEYEFLIPLSPTPLIVQNNAIYFGEVGYVYPVMSGHHHGTQIEYCDIANYNITINKTVMETRMKEKGLIGKEFNSRFEYSSELSTLIQLFISYFNDSQFKDIIDLNIIGYLIVSRIIEDGCLRTSTDRRKPPLVYQKGMVAVSSFIQSHFKENLTIEELAKISGFSKNYFISAFKKAIGDSPYTYIQKLRLSHAKLLLVNTNLSVNDIAIQCGFNKLSSFTSIFKTETKMTPSEYRRAKQSE